MKKEYEVFTCATCGERCGMIHTGTMVINTFEEDPATETRVICITDEKGFMLYSPPTFGLEIDNLSAFCIGCQAPIDGTDFCRIAYDQH